MSYLGNDFDVGGQDSQLELGFVERHGKTVLDRRQYSYPFSVSRVFRLESSPRGTASVILQTASGTLNGGDRVAGCLRAGPGAAAQVWTQGATVVHRAPLGTTVSERFELFLDDGAMLEYLPQPRILFPDSRLVQSNRISIGRAAVAILYDGFVTYDPAHKGRQFAQLEAETEVVSSDGLLLAMDRASILAPIDWTGRRASYKAFGTLLIATRAESLHRLSELSAAIRSVTSDIDGLYGFPTQLPNDCGVLLRLAGYDGRRLRVGLDVGRVAARRYLVGNI